MKPTELVVVQLIKLVLPKVSLKNNVSQTFPLVLLHCNSSAGLKTQQDCSLLLSLLPNAIPVITIITSI